ncbi:MAG: ABC transporter ATP-binding protein [Bryobacteraceae bacterium]
MIQARIAKRFAGGKESSGFALDVEFEAVRGVTVLFGPSGAGKTLILDSIAGFVRPDSGRILLDDEILFDGSARVSLRPQRRRCGYVFQNYALFPHMTLRDNLSFAVEHLPRLERHRRVTEMIERFRLAHAAGRKPHEVSGGEKQRCSIARALIGTPKLLLLDEPARGLDAPLRADLYEVLRQVRQQFDVPVLLVTHDLDECFEVGDVMMVIEAGRIVQTGTPLEVTHRPASVGVARLLGASNLLEAEITALDPGRNTSRLRLADFELNAHYLPGHLLGDHVWLWAPASELRARPGSSQGARPGPNQVPSPLIRVSERLRSVRLEFARSLTVEVTRDEFAAQKDNKEWLVEFPPEAIRVL